jgi:hypothetical protein
MRRSVLYIVLVLLLLAGCNFPLAKTSATEAVVAAIPQTLSGPGVQIVSPADGSQLDGTVPIPVQFISAGGPFIEAELSENSNSLGTLSLPSDNTSPAGTITWSAPTAGSHTLTVDVMTADKQIYTTSIQVNVVGSIIPTQGQTTTPTLDPARDIVMTQMLQIFHDTYGLNLTSPPLARKNRGVGANDPWHSVVYVGNWMYDLAVYPDRVSQTVLSLNMQSDGSVPIAAGEKTFPICRPSGTLKILVALVDFQNLDVTKEQALGALDAAVQDINAKLAEYSIVGGATSPILQLQIKGVFLSPPPSMPDHLLTPEIVKSVSGVDPAAYDLLVQIDLDGNNTYRKIIAARNFDTNGFMRSSCLGNDLSIWMALDTKDQALGLDTEKELERVLSHELLHTFGYPFDHSWIAGDGSQPDATDETDIYGWPTLMLGWTDTDGDGIPEIIDPTPYGSTAR